MTDRDAYDAGHTAGGIDARLAGHDQHFARINGSLADIAREMQGVKLALQRLADGADADRNTALATAAALKTADEVRRAQATDRWSPWQKAVALLAALAAIASIVAFILKTGGHA
jgi:hypothetical protein